MSVTFRPRAATVLPSLPSALHTSRDLLHRVVNRTGRIRAMLCSLQLDSQSLTKLLNVNLSISRVPNYTHQSRLKRFYFATFGKEPLKIIVDAGFLNLELFVFLLRSFELLIKLSNLSVSELKLLFSTLNILQNIVVRLVCPLDQAFVKLSLGFARFKLLFELLYLLEHALSFFLLLLQAIGK